MLFEMVSVPNRGRSDPQVVTSAQQVRIILAHFSQFPHIYSSTGTSIGTGKAPSLSVLMGLRHCGSERAGD